jgi:NitT/TauT family transport system substrate-binding protein
VGKFSKIAFVAVACAMAFCLAACSSNSANSSSQNTEGVTGNSATVVKIGTMPTEDILPLWVAQEEGLAGDAVQYEIVTFDSAAALSAAVASGQVDMCMTDPMRAEKMAEAGVDVEIEWITLGETADQGRFGVLVSENSPYNTLADLAQAASSGEIDETTGVGLAANTVPEYVFDMLCEQAGIDASAIPTTEIASLPDRYSLAASGGICAAALPASMLALGESNSLKVIADDATGQNISQSVMVATGTFAKNNQSAILEIAQIWDNAVAMINENPNEYRDLLAQNANLNSSVAQTYQVSTYPTALESGALKHAPANLIEPVFEWMQQKGYSSAAAAYDEQTGQITVK